VSVDVPALLDRLADGGWTVAVAESLTGGLVLASLTEVPGASRVVRGGVVAYATDVKADLVGVDAALLTRVGAVHPDVARALAEGVRDRLGATYGVGTTGVAGPDQQDGRPVGEVHIAVAGPDGTVVQTLGGGLSATRGAVRQAAVAAALGLLDAVVRESGR
jgi:nicotinamide-nucleotide amidase